MSELSTSSRARDYLYQLDYVSDIDSDVETENVDEFSSGSGELFQPENEPENDSDAFIYVNYHLITQNKAYVWIRAYPPD